jgi:HEAT repeat protein
VNLIHTLQDFDGKRTVVLERLNATLPRNESSMAQLLAVAEHDDTTLQVGATWILKRWFEDGEPLIERSVSNLVQLLKHASYWEVRLHLLQILAFVPIPTRSLSVLKKVLHEFLTNENKFVRAWALSVFASIADQNESLRSDALSMLQSAEHDEAASVRARVRQIHKRFKWTTDSGRTM